jgi:hypothetical protein
MNKRTFVAVALLALIAAAPLLAHHSLAGVYDLNKTERATGVVQKFAFNPALNGATIGFLRSIVLGDKKEVEFVPN